MPHKTRSYHIGRCSFRFNQEAWKEDKTVQLTMEMELTISQLRKIYRKNDPDPSTNTCQDSGYLSGGEGRRHNEEGEHSGLLK